MRTGEEEGQVRKPTFKVKNKLGKQERICEAALLFLIG
jgi:hypothetical protein